MLKFALACAALALSLTAIAQPVPYWTATQSDPIAADGAASVIDNSGDLYVATAGTLHVDGAMAYIRVTKFGPNGEMLWQASSPTASDEYNGYCTDAWLCPDGGVIVRAAYTGDSDAYGFSKFSAAGVHQWTILEGDLASHLAMDTDGSFFISSGNDRGGIDATVQKFSAAGVQQWQVLVGNTGVAHVNAIVPDGSGGVWATGSYFPPVGSGGFFLTDITGNPTEIDPAVDSTAPAGRQIIASGDGNFIVARGQTIAKVSSNLTQAWSVPLPSGESVRKLVLDPSSNIIVCCANDAVMKISPAGVLQWTNQPGTLTRDLLVDPGANIFVLGGNDSIIKYLPSGALGWPNLTNGQLHFAAQTGAEFLGNISRDNAGFLYVGAAAFDSTTPISTFEGIKFGPANNAMFVTQSVPSSMVAGQSYSVSVTMKNTGVTNWTSGNGFYLRSQNPTDNTTWGRKAVNLSSSETIMPGQTKKFSFTVYAPMNAGTYNFQWRMAQNTSSFGTVSPNVAVPVAVKFHAARYISQVVPSAVKAGSQFTVSVTMENVGLNTWTLADGYGLAPVPGYPTWGITKVPMLAGDSIARGQNKTFTFMCTAPSTAGTYSMRFQMRRDASAFTGFFGDKTTVKSITVTP